jgi:mercuric ion transport protein
MNETPIDPGPAAGGSWPVGLLAGISTLFGGGAAFAASCCVVPLSLAALGATGAVSSVIGTLAPYQAYLLGFSALALAGGWLTFWRGNRAAACAADGSCPAPRIRRRGRIALVVATAIVAVAFGRGYLEPIVVGRFLGGA